MIWFLKIGFLFLSGFFFLVFISLPMNLKPKYYLVSYSYSYGLGSLTISVPNGGDLDISYVKKYLEDRKDLEGVRFINSFQEITEKQFYQWNHPDERKEV